MPGRRAQARPGSVAARPGSARGAARARARHGPVPCAERPGRPRPTPPAPCRRRLGSPRRAARLLAGGRPRQRRPARRRPGRGPVGPPHPARPRRCPRRAQPEHAPEPRPGPQPMPRYRRLDSGVPKLAARPVGGWSPAGASHPAVLAITGIPAYSPALWGCYVGPWPARADTRRGSCDRRVCWFSRSLTAARTPDGQPRRACAHAAGSWAACQDGCRSCLLFALVMEPRWRSTSRVRAAR